VADSAVARADGSLLAEEAKSRVGGGNPLSNRAVDLWKTLRKWIEAAEGGRPDPHRTTFQLYVSRAFDSDIATRFAEATPPDEVDAAFTYAWATLGVDLSASDPCGGLAATIREHVAHVVHADPAQRIRVRTRGRRKRSRSS